MSPTTLLLIRHGHTRENSLDGSARLSGWHDSPLSQLGLRESTYLAQHVLHESPAALYTSTLARTRQTAAPLADAWRVRPIPDPALREISCGDLDGVPLVQVEHRFPVLWHRNISQSDVEFRWPGGESYREFRERAIDAIRAIAHKHHGERVAVVTHAGVISQVLGYLHGGSPARWSLWRPRNASLTEIRWDGSAGDLIRFDWQPTGMPSGGALRAPDRIRTPQDSQMITGGVGGGRPRA
jgi:broad specificity phosphatase PhoE